MTLRPNEQSATEAARAIESGDLTAEALVRSCFDRIDDRDGTIGAWAFLDRERTLREARTLDRTPRRSRLHGVPFGIKDVIDTADAPTEYNSPIYRGHRPRADAACVMLLRRAGCLVLGKTVTTEFANVHPAHTRNPRNPDHTPGGSSSGSAAAVADWMVMAALGTQTAGSVIRPAAYCGVFAIKPSFGSIIRTGVKVLAETLDTIGLFAREPEDLALAQEVLSSRRASGVPGRAPRIGLCRTANWHALEASAQANFDRAAKLLERAGARVVDFWLPADTEALFDAQKTVMDFESARSLAWELSEHPTLLSAALRERLERGWQISREEYDTVRATAAACRLVLAQRMEGVDFLLTPGASGPAPLVAAGTGDSRFNRAWTLLGMPCVNVPFGLASGGLPLGLQIVGAIDADMDLLAWARWMADRLKRS